MIRKRFPGSRVARIVGWTAMATAWAAVGIRVVAADSPVEAPPATEPAVDAPSDAPAAAIPAMPEGGLVVLRYTPAPEPEPVQVTRVVERRVVVQQAPRGTSSGS